MKIVNKDRGLYIVWMVDLFSKLIKGKFVSDKKPSTIIEAIVSTWVVGDGCGPGHPRRGFWSDNGGEFLNHEVLDYAAAQDVDIKMTAANSPWQNGVVERHHATADIIVGKLIMEDPQMSYQDAINQACFAKNGAIGQSRFSPLQLMMGQSPFFPGLSQANPASSNMNSSSKYMKTLKHIDETRVAYRKVECDDKLKKALSQRINPNVEKYYNLGDPVFFYNDKKKEWKKGTALIRLGKTLYLRYGNFLRRVAIEKVRPDYNGEVAREERYIDPADDEEENEQRFTEEESPVKDMAEDLDLANENVQLKSKVTELERKLEAQSSKQDTTESKEKEVTNETADNDTDVEAKTKETVMDKRQLKRQRQKDKKRVNIVILPKLNQTIQFKEHESDCWQSGRIIKTFKKSSKWKNSRHVELSDGGIVQIDFIEDISEWKVKDENREDVGLEVVEPVEPVESYHLSDILSNDDSDDVFPVRVLTKSEYERPEIAQAMKDELEKFKSFNAYKEVHNDGQYCIPVKWVVTEQKLDGKNQPYKARLCIRGDKELGKEEGIRADSPTASKDSLNIALSIAANEGFRIKCGDIKSAYLQGAKLDREVFVTPPPQANCKGKLWQLLQGAYGILDGGRLFYLKLTNKLQHLGLHKVHADGALFSYVVDGKLHGVVTTNVDDLIMAGDELFDVEVVDKLQEEFKFSKVELDSFNYCGCSFSSVGDGSIELNQNEYIDKLDYMENVEGDDEDELGRKEKKQARGKIGALLWISLVSRPDLSFAVNKLSSEVSDGRIRTVKEINRIIKQAKAKRNKLRFCKLGDISKLSVRVYADASLSNQEEGLRSTAGRVTMIENEETKVNIVSWKTKKISRVCRSAKGAETRALEDALDDAVNTARIIREVYDGKIELKNPAQIPVVAYTDSKSLWESLHNSRQCEEKLLRNSISGIKELMELGAVKNVHWVPTTKKWLTA